jgi:hypothetical protein
MIRRAVPVLLLCLAAILLPGSAAGATSAWQITASPTTLPYGQPTQVVLTVTGGAQPIGLVTITIPSGYQILRSAVISTPPDQVWTAAVASTTLVKFSAGTSKTRIQSGNVARFGITVVPTAAKPPAWVAAAYSQNSGTSDGRPVKQLPAFKITGAPAPTPTPTPSPTPSPTPTPTPTPSPVPSSSETPGSSASPDSSSSPDSSASPAAGASDSPAPGDLPSAEPSPGAPVGGGPAPSLNPGVIVLSSTQGPDSGATPGIDVYSGGSTQVVIPTQAPGGAVAVSGLDGLSGLTVYSWLVPSFFLGLPGVLVLLVVLAQFVVGALFLPLSRVVLGGFGFRKRSGGTVAR